MNLYGLKNRSTIGCDLNFDKIEVLLVESED